MASSEKQLRELAAPVPDLTGVTQPQGTDLTASQQKALETVLAHFSQPDYELSGAKDGEGKLREEEMFWLSFECMLRYLRATKWVSAQAAIKRLEETLAWRREFGLYDERFTPEHVEPEALTGKEVVFGFDVNGRPALYLCPSRQNTDESIRQVQFNVFMLERCIELMGPGVESVALMIDYGQKSAKSPSISLSRMVLNILQTHYPERLGRALIINVPFLLNAFYKLITPLIDPVTRDKMRFNPKAVEDGLFTVDSVWKEFGGNIEFKYEHSTYWPQFMEMTTARRKVQMEKWHSLGGKVGLKEWDIKGGDDNTQVPDAGEKSLGDSET
ncbi:hypothetical protein EW026_g2285 [Hermanssonia centrifuga]|uniref:CRAL-TRIO domain-containing protein n=1 Tax=Hermanssonia centrifuga TaxID=98765 RepID=A0A4S4KNS2_9APHY|nr:hypothetical protein EW026_g2285 [Hermanssonia centrifuga]